MARDKDRDSTGVIDIRPATRAMLLRRRLRLRDAWEQALEMPWLWLALFLLLATWTLTPGVLLFPNRAVAGAVADRDYVAIRDFPLNDDEATRVKQQLYIQSMIDHDIVISIGPAGTGKTYLAVAMAAAALLEKRVRRIILARPAVEAGEKLGFLPGDLVEKVNPYLRPLHDALHDIIGYEKVGRMLERGIIEIAPIGFMRGRTLNDSFIILDEAQNTTSEQMKMFLTRIGFNSKAVINGDVTQVDLPQGRTSGLKEAQEVLSGVEGIKFFYFDQRDVVRHSLVQEIVSAYERHDEERLLRDAEARTGAVPGGAPAS